MSETITARTQYGDLQGTVSFDGHSSPPLMKLAELTDMPPYFGPIAFELSRLSPREDGTIPFKIIAVDTTTVGGTQRDLDLYLTDHETIPLRRFHGAIKPAELESYFKRFSLFAIHKAFKDFEDKMQIEP